MSDLKYELFHLSIKHWINYEFLTWRWFLKILLLIMFVFLFYKFADRKRILEIVAYGLFISLVSTVLDVIGTLSGLWEYPYRLLPLEFSEIHDFVVIPIVYMLAYQYFPGWKAFIIANTILAGISAFVMEPIFIMLKFYRPIAWEHIYSFPIFLAIAIIGKFFISKLKPG